MQVQSKREFLVSVASQCKNIDEDKFNNLLDLYRIPSEARRLIKTPTTLFHYLDIGDNLCLKLLRDNLHIAGFRRLSLYIEEHIDSPKETRPNISKTMRILNTLREGLTTNNIEDLKFLLGLKSKDNNFENYLLSLITRRKMGKIDVTFLNDSLKFLNYETLGEKLESFFDKKIEQVSLSNEEMKRFDLMKIGKEIDEEEYLYLCFLLFVPVGIMQSFKRPMELFYYLDSKEFLNFSDIIHALRIIGRGYLLEELVYLGEDSEIIPLYIQSGRNMNIFEEIQNSLMNEDILHLSFLAGSQKLIIDFSEYLVKLIEFEKFCQFDVEYLIQTLKAIKRADLSQIITNIENSKDDQVDVLNTRNSKENEQNRKIFSLLAQKLTGDDTEKIALLYDVPSRLMETIYFPIQLMYYLYYEKKIEITDLEDSLKIVNRYELIKYIR